MSAHSPEGDTSETPAKFPYSERELARALQDVELSLARSAAITRRVPGKDEQPLQALGAELFAFLFPGPVRDHLATVRGRAARDDEVVQLRLRIRPPELAALPWELLYDQARDDYLSLSTPVVRYLEVLEPVEPLTVTGPVRVLGMVARPGALSELDIEHERRWLNEALTGLAGTGPASTRPAGTEQVELTWANGQTWRDLQAGLDRLKPNVLHFIGHGGFDDELGEGHLALTAESGGVHRLSASDLGLLLGERRSLRLVVLNSCEGARASAGDVFSSTAAVLTRRGIPAVVAMQYEISDQAATTFARGLYGAIAVGFGVDQAVTRARRDIKISRGASLEWATPVLYLRSPDPRLFDLSQPTSLTQPVNLSQPTPSPYTPVVATPAPEEPKQREQPPQPPPSQRRPAASARSPKPHPLQANSPHPQIEPGSLLFQINAGSVVHAMTLSPDGTRLATTAYPVGTARIWDAVTGVEVARLTHQGQINSVKFSPDGTRLATVSVDQTARTWDATTGSELIRMTHQGPASAVAFSPDGTRLATASWDKTARIWAVATGDELTRLRHGTPVSAVAFSPDGTRVATASWDRTARTWPADGDKPAGIRGPWGRVRAFTRMTHDGEISKVGFSPDGTRLVTYGGNHISGVTARIWATTDGRELTHVTHNGYITMVVFISDGACLATSSWDKTVRTWDTATGRELTRMTHDKVSGVTFSPDGTHLATASDNTARIRDTATGRELTRMTHDKVIDVIFSPDGTRLATRGSDHVIRIWAV